MMKNEEQSTLDKLLKETESEEQSTLDKLLKEAESEEQSTLDELLKEAESEEERKNKRRQKRKRRVYLARLILCLALCLLLAFVFLLITISTRYQPLHEQIEETFEKQAEEEIEKEKYVRLVTAKPEMTEHYLTPNEYSRPGETLPEVNSIFIHYTANASTTAEQNRSYFENLAETKETSASAHFIIGYEGEIVQCLPLSEIGYAVKGRNYDSISIECCYIEKGGRFTDATYQSLIELVSWLLGEYDLTSEDVLRHYDEGGKNCPKYFVENETKWNVFKKAVDSYRKRYGVERSLEEEDGTVDSEDEKE